RNFTAISPFPHDFGCKHWYKSSLEAPHPAVAVPPMEKIMKPARVFAVMGLFLIFAGPSLHAACTSATATGTFGFTTTGTLILPGGPVPVAAVGSITFQLNGD